VVVLHYRLSFKAASKLSNTWATSYFMRVSRMPHSIYSPTTASRCHITNEYRANRLLRAGLIKDIPDSSYYSGVRGLVHREHVVNAGGCSRSRKSTRTLTHTLRRCSRRCGYSTGGSTGSPARSAYSGGFRLHYSTVTKEIRSDVFFFNSARRCVN